MPILGSVVKRALAIRKKTRISRVDPIRYQEKTLQKLIRTAKDTAFGVHYRFEDILKNPDPIRAFQQTVPLTSYQQIFRAWWNRSLNEEEDICWPGKVKYFALSSGTSEATTKYIPVTKEMLKGITKASMKQFYSMANFNLPSETFAKGVFTLGSSTNLIRKGDYFIGDMSGIQAGNSIPFWVNRFFKPGKKINRVRDWDDKLNEIAKHATSWDISIICGIPAWVQLMIERILEYHKADTLHDVWPNLRVYIHGGIAFEPYRKNFEKLFSHKMTYIETYMASEGFFAFRSMPSMKGMQLILNNGIFFEFVPFNSSNFDEDGELKSEARAYHIGEIEEGIDYAVVLSNCSGAWRYLIGDTVQFLDATTKEMIVTGRTKHFLSICGEHLSVDNMNRAIQMTGEVFGIAIPEFTVSGIPYENLFAHRWYIGTDEPIDEEAFRKRLDQNLRSVNDDYATERDNVLKDIQVRAIPTDWFYDFLKAQGKIGDQAKFPRVLKKERFAAWEAYVNTRLSALH